MRIKRSTNHIVNKIHNLNPTNKIVIVIQFPSIQVPIRQPVGRIRTMASVVVDQSHKQRPQIVPNGDGDPVQRRGGAPHALRRLVVEELEVADGHEHLRHAVEAELRDEPEDADGHHGFRVVEEPVARGRGPALGLDEPGRGGGQHVDGQADPHALQARDPRGAARDAAGEGDEEALVEGEAEEDGERAEDGEAGGRDLEGRVGPSEAAVHGAGLLDDEAVLVRVGRDEEDRGGPNGKHSDHAFQLLYSVDCGESPKVYCLWFCCVASCA